MIDLRPRRRGTATAAIALFVGAAVVLAPAGGALGATSISGPVNLGTATPFGVLGASAVTNTGTTTITGDVGVNPQTSISGFPPGIVFGAVHTNDAVALQAQTDLTAAYNVAASLTPASSGYTDLSGQSFTPGVYSGQAVSLTGVLNLVGTADSVWVFQVASSLITGSGSSIVVTGGATACNVFWQVGSSATLGTSSTFVGTIMAKESITATTNAVITGRLLADTGAVTLDSNVINAPPGCADASGTVVTTSPTITSGAPTATATAGTPYSYTIAASGTGTMAYSIVGGSLPTGLTLDSATGVISGTPTTAGSYTFTVSASNGSAPDSTATYTIVVSAAAALAATGAHVLVPVAVGGLLLLTGAGLLVAARARRAHRQSSRHAVR